MVKADAYGLGMERVLSALAPESPWGFGVATVAEGEAARRFGWTGRVLVLSPVLPGEYARAAAAGLTLGLSDVGAVRRWAAAGAAAGRAVDYHIEIDTGMGRAGLPWRDAGSWGAALADASGPDAHWEGCYTHFHSADEPELAPTDEQWDRFQQALRVLPPAPKGRLVHSSNSAATLRRGGFGGDLIRPGIFLYGAGAGADIQPEPVASLRARVSLVKSVPAGATVGYGATYRAAGPERWATLAIGYGDGLRRALAPAGGEALVHGRRVPLIGRISMDVAVVNVSAVPDVEPGAVATLIGRDGGHIPLDEVAARCGTISYEILTGLGPRLPRVYTGSEPT